MRWERFGEQRDGLPDHVIAGAEMLLGVQFPEDYRSCVRENHGAQPDPDAFSVGTSDEMWEGNVGELLTLDPRNPTNIFSVISNLAVDEQLPNAVIPIADDGGGNLICLDYRHDRSRARPVISFWFHEVGGADGLVLRGIIY